jgi:hypothetical protein
MDEIIKRETKTWSIKKNRKTRYPITPTIMCSIKERFHVRSTHSISFDSKKALSFFTEPKVFCIIILILFYKNNQQSKTN